MVGSTDAISGRWAENRSNQWYANQPWLVGANYIPADAANQLEMWQTETFNPDLINREPALAESLGINTMRVLLHGLLWEQDAEGLVDRIKTYLDITSKHGIRTMFVLFDSCWRPDSNLGVQPAPVPGVHNAQWLQNPGNAALSDPSQEARLQAYVEGVVGTFANDDRVLIWDIWNEPGNLNGALFAEVPNKRELIQALMPKVFAWARNAKPTQPLTSGAWMVEENQTARQFSDDPLYDTQMANSDFFTFHSYEAPAQFEARILAFGSMHPVLVTEYMGRNQGSTFEAILPIVKKHKVGAYNWGFVAGKTQTNLPWDSWRQPYVDREPAVWFHDVFHTDGRRYRYDEVAFIRQITAE